MTDSNDASTRRGQAGMAAAAPPSMATVAAAAGGGAVSYFLRLDPIVGDSTDERHQDWIDVLAFSWLASNTAGAIGSGGGTAGKGTIAALNLVAPTGSASPRLFLHTMDGRHLKTALLQGVTGGERGERFLEVELEDVTVSSYATSGASESPTDSFSLLFRRIRYTIWPQDPKGGAGQPIEATWNLARSSEG